MTSNAFHRTPKLKLYADWDGVINAHTPAHELVEQFTVLIEGSQHIAPKSIITYSPTVVEFIDTLRIKYGVELIWLTTWNEYEHILTAVQQLGGGLADGKVLPANLNVEAKNKAEWTQWKADAIIADQAADPAPFVWFDDNAHAFHDEAVRAATSTVPSLFVTPVSDTGLTLQDLHLTEGFFAQHS